MTNARFSRRPIVGLFALASMLSPVSALAASAPATVVTSTSWAGYAATGSTYTSITTTFTVPKVTCPASSTDGYADFWAGLDGYSSSSVEQAGVAVECANGTADYYAWYEAYPANAVYLSNTVKVGDVITVTVAFSGTDTYTFTIENVTEAWTKIAKVASSGDARSSAEIIVEAPAGTGGALPPARFSSVTFTGCKVDGDTLGSFDPTEITSPGLTVSPITGGTEFTVTEAKSPALG
jgi:Peptidase A4 family